MEIGQRVLRPLRWRRMLILSKEVIPCSKQYACAVKVYLRPADSLKRDLIIGFHSKRK
jgi:hypothetical protein